MLKNETREEISNSLPVILSIKDAASFLRCSDLTIRRMIYDGQLIAFKEGEEWQIARPDLITYLSRHSSL